MIWEQLCRTSFHRAFRKKGVRGYFVISLTFTHLSIYLAFLRSWLFEFFVQRLRSSYLVYMQAKFVLRNSFTYYAYWNSGQPSLVSPPAEPVRCGGSRLLSCRAVLTLSISKDPPLLESLVGPG